MFDWNEVCIEEAYYYEMAASLLLTAIPVFRG